jgi:hypothetical protein
MDHGDEARSQPLTEALPEREPADHQVAAGAVAGLAGGAAMWLAAMLAARTDMGFTFPLRLVAASLMGETALDSGQLVAPLLLGTLLVAMTSVLFGLVYTSILPEGVDVFAAMLVGVVYSAALWLVTWFVLARVLDPILYAAGRPLHMLALHAFYGAVLGLLVPFLRKVLP